LDLLKKCGNCVKNGSTCELSSTMVDFSQIDCSMAKLEEQEAAAEAEEEAMATQMLELKEIMNQMSNVHGWLHHLCKQKKLLKEREKALFNKGMAEIEEIKALEEQECLASKAAIQGLISSTKDTMQSLDYAVMSPESFGHFLETLPDPLGATSSEVAGSS
jgi:hypothetical protein